MKKFLVAVDSSPLAPIVIAEAVRQARAHDATLLLLRVVGIPVGLPLDIYSVSPDNISDILEKTAQTELAELAQYCPQELLGGERVVVGVPWRTICDLARSEGVAMIIMGAHGHQMLDSIMGTTATRVINHADRTTLVVRGPAKD